MEYNYINDNLRLRPFIETDIGAALKWYADPIVLSGTISPNRTDPCSEQMIRAMYRDLGRRGQFFIIEYNDTKWIPIGDVTLAKDTMPVVIGESRYRGKGIAKAVILHLLKIARSSKWEKITLKEIYKDNLASQKLYHSCGFQQTSESDESFIYEIMLQ